MNNQLNIHDDNNTSAKVVSEDLRKFYLEFRRINKQHAEVRDENRNLLSKVSYLETEIAEAKKSERFHREQLQTARSTITDLQNSVSHLLYIKEDLKKMNQKLEAKDKIISGFNEEKDLYEKRHMEEMEHIKEECEIKLANLQTSFDVKIENSAFQMQELTDQMKQLEEQCNEKMNVVVLEYEEKLQRSAAQICQLRDQFASLTANNKACVEVHQKKISTLENKIKSMEFDAYVAKNCNITEQPNSSMRQPNLSSSTRFINSITEPHGEVIMGGSKPLSKVNARKVAPFHMAYSSEVTPLLNVSVSETPQTAKSVKKRKLFSNKDVMQ